MKIYRIKTDTNNIQLVQPTDYSLITDREFLDFKCEPRNSNWKELEVFIYNPKTKPKNFYRLTSGILVFDEHVLEFCQTIFEMAGEILLMQIERGKKLYLLNILKCMNGLDYGNTIWDYYADGAKGRILEYKFHEWKVKNEATIFKIPETYKTDIFCFTDERDEDDQFYHLYHKHKLTGLIFEEINNS